MLPEALSAYRFLSGREGHKLEEVGIHVPTKGVMYREKKNMGSDGFKIKIIKVVAVDNNMSQYEYICRVFQHYNMKQLRCI